MSGRDGRTGVGRLVGVTPLNVATLLAVSALLVGSHVFFPHWSTRYGAWLVVFTIWMAWFVATFGKWFRRADF